MKGAVLFLIAGAVMAAEPLMLPDALRQAGAAGFQADAARLGVSAAKEDVMQAKALFLPEIQFQGGLRLLDKEPALVTSPIHLGPIPLGPGLAIPPLTLPGQVTPVEDRSSWRYRASVQYVVWDFGMRRHLVEAAQAKVQAVQEGGGAELRRAQAEVAGRYLALMNLQAQKQVLTQRRQVIDGHLGVVKDLFAHGVVARNDLLRTEVALRSLEDADHALESARRSLAEALNTAMGRALETAVEMPTQLPGLPALPWDEAACRLRAQERNEAVRALQAKARAQEKLAGFRRQDLWPKIVAEASHTYAQNSHMLHNRENALSLGLSWKLFDGGQRSARISQAEAETSRARRELLEAQRQAEQAASAAFRSFQQARREMDTAQANVKAAEENLRIVSDQYKEGLLRTTDVLDAEAVLAESRSALAERRCRAFTQQAVLLAAMGEDLPAFFETTSSLEK